MLKFKQLNLNPRGYDTTDCVARALAYALKISWEEAIMLQCKWAKKLKYGLTSNEVFEHILLSSGFTKYTPKKLYYHSLSYTIKDLDHEFKLNFRQQNIIVVLLNGHCAVVDGDSYVDSSDSGDYAVVDCYYKFKDA